MEKTGEATYWVDFEYTVDLSPAYQMEWSERGWFVFNTLKEQAAKSQATAVSLLEASGVSYESFWIANRILVKDSNRTVLASLQQLPGVVAVRAPQTYAIYEPEVAPVEPMAVEANIDHVNAPDVWDLGYTGTGYTVANIDTGVRYSHQALVNQYRGNNGDGSFTHDYNWLNPNGYESAPPRDGHGHGSHTMGTMVGDDGGTNQIGMAPGAQWIACAGCPDGSCPDYALLTCAQFVVAPQPAPTVPIPIPTCVPMLSATPGAAAAELMIPGIANLLMPGRLLVSILSSPMVTQATAVILLLQDSTLLATPHATVTSQALALLERAMDNTHLTPTGSH